MLKFTKLLFISLSIGLIACDNEVDLNADFEDTTVVYALINAYEDTQFVKVNRAYIEKGANALELASDASKFNYENLDVKIIRPDNGDTFQLQTIKKRKEEGLFSTSDNVLYYTTENFETPVDYDLNVTQIDGKVTSARVKTLGRVSLLRPEVRQGERRNVTFVDQRGQYVNYEFIIRLTSQVSEAQVSLIFYYDEEENGVTTRRSVEIPGGGISNTELKNEDGSIFFNGEIFYRTVGNLVPDNGLKKIVQLRDNIGVKILAVDPVYTQYTKIYGPLDGLAQVRPEYTNVVNGIGVVASRSTEIYLSWMDDFSRSQLFNGPYTRGLNFSNP